MAGSESEPCIRSHSAALVSLGEISRSKAPPRLIRSCIQSISRFISAVYEGSSLEKPHPPGASFKRTTTTLGIATSPRDRTIAFRCEPGKRPPYRFEGDALQSLSDHSVTYCPVVFPI
jgi:hypothetical protein